MRAASQRTCALPPARSMRFSFPCEPNAIDLLSGDQNGSSGSSVPGSSFASDESSERTHSCHFPSCEVAVNAIFCPSGEITAESDCASLNARFGGTANASLIARDPSEDCRHGAQVASSASTTASAAILHGKTRRDACCSGEMRSMLDVEAAGFAKYLSIMMRASPIACRRAFGSFVKHRSSKFRIAVGVEDGKFYQT